MIGVDAGNRYGIKIGANDPGRRRRLLHLGNDLDPWRTLQGRPKVARRRRPFQLRSQGMFRNVAAGFFHFLTLGGNDLVQDSAHGRKRLQTPLLDSIAGAL
jgi:hypothetical protein